MYDLLLLQDYGDHIAEITNKLVAIMDGMLDSNLKKVSLN